MHAGTRGGGNCNWESYTSDTVSLLGSASAHCGPCVDCCLLHVRQSYMLLLPLTIEYQFHTLPVCSYPE
jgi:hypothetical protein